MPRRFAPRQHLTISQKVKIGGEGGIRTLDTLADILDFESSAFDHSATSPWFECGQIVAIKDALVNESRKNIDLITQSMLNFC